MEEQKVTKNHPSLLGESQARKAIIAFLLSVMLPTLTCAILKQKPFPYFEQNALWCLYNAPRASTSARRYYVIYVSI